MSDGDVDTYNYKGWLISDSFWKRALAVMAYSIVGQLIVFLIIGILIVVLVVITAFVFGMGMSGII
ncbi:MAG: hypothetical protein APR53_02935 [Methanoculleus sp. SDB]|nr:MAG: hypothetical protein APR53_02935 [Methanoculleus sp. SDB]